MANQLIQKRLVQVGRGLENSGVPNPKIQFVDLVEGNHLQKKRLRPTGVMVMWVFAFRELWFKVFRRKARIPKTERNVTISIA